MRDGPRHLEMIELLVTDAVDGRADLGVMDVDPLVCRS